MLFLHFPVLMMHLSFYALVTGFYLKNAGEFAVIPAAKHMVVNDKNAVCLDGTYPAYFVWKGAGTGTNKFYLHHEGGGWCNSDANCAQRAKSYTGSSKSLSNVTDLQELVTAWGAWYLSNDPTVNPLMHNWNKILLHYCDGASWSGANMTITHYHGKNIYYRGKLIIVATVKDFISTLHMDEASDVVVSGGSAGGLATFLHVDYYRSQLPSVRVTALPDGGFFLDEQINGCNFRRNMQWLFNAHNCTSGVNQACISNHTQTGDEWRCMFAEHMSPFLVTPTFNLGSQYDSYQTNSILCSHDATTINQYGTNFTNRLHSNLLVQSSNGAFIDSCHHHTGGWNTLICDEGIPQAVAFQAWYQGGKSPSKDNIWKQSKSYPCAKCCPCPCGSSGGCTQCCQC